MGLKSMTILQGGTVAVSAGTAKTFVTDGKSIVNGLHTVDDSVVDFRLRPSMTWRYRAPALQNDGTWSKGKWSCVIDRPALLADGSVTINRQRSEFEVHPECAATIFPLLKSDAAQVSNDADTTAFYNVGSLE